MAQTSSLHHFCFDDQWKPSVQNMHLVAGWKVPIEFPDTRFLQIDELIARAKRTGDVLREVLSFMEVGQSASESDGARELYKECQIMHACVNEQLWSAIDEDVIATLLSTLDNLTQAMNAYTAALATRSNTTCNDIMAPSVSAPSESKTLTPSSRPPTTLDDQYVDLAEDDPDEIEIIDEVTGEDPLPSAPKSGRLSWYGFLKR